MLPLRIQIALRARLLLTRLLERLGFGDHAILVPLAVLIGILTAGAAVAFHELIVLVRNLLYERMFDRSVLYGWGLPLLVLLPAAGGLVVGYVSRHVTRVRAAYSVVDIIETVLRSRGRIRPVTAIEKILTSAITIGTGGSAGAEGPIVQIGAAVSSFVGSLFQTSKAHLPVLIGCGTAAGISAIFGAPIGGVLFTLEVILLDFSIRSFTPIAVASVVSHVTAQALFQQIHGSHGAIFFVSHELVGGMLEWRAVPAVAMLGVACALIAVAFTRCMHQAEERFAKLRVRPEFKPAIGGALLGLLGVVYISFFGWFLLGQPKPIEFENYPMPAIFGDGYGAVQALIADESMLARFPPAYLVMLLAFLVLAKIVGTCFTLGSGGSGGVIAPSLFLGAVGGTLVGELLDFAGWDAGLSPSFFALIGMGAVLAAVVHAPLASILILMEVTNQRHVVLPAMLACVVATGIARTLSRDSIYTLGLRRRGVVTGTGADAALLRRLTVDQVALGPVRTVSLTEPLERLFELVVDHEEDFVVIDSDGRYAGLVLAEDLRTAMLQREAAPFLLVEDLARPDLPAIHTTDDLGSVFDTFGRHETTSLAVCVTGQSGRVVGLMTRKALMRTYHEAMVGK